MSLILLEFDNQLQQTPVTMPLSHISKDEIGTDPDTTGTSDADAKQTEVYGILTPIIEINNVAIRFDLIVSFNLNSTGITPTIDLCVNDVNDLSRTLDTPKKDKLQLRIIILPPFENAYKKITLSFYISNISIRNSKIYATGIYKIPGLIETQYKSLGEMNTYNLVKKIAKDTKLGFATNIKENDKDKRYIYCNNKSYLNTLTDEMQKSGDENQILECWIDWWNNINLVDIKERYEAIDSTEDMMIWTTGQYNIVDEKITRKPYQIVALLNNNPLSRGSELYVEKFEIINHSSPIGSKTIKTTWNMNTNQQDDCLIVDEDVEKDIIYNYEYLGESYGDINYLKTNTCRKQFLKKICKQSIKVKLKTPFLGLMRGQKVNFVWYNTNELLNTRMQKLEEKGFINKNKKTNIPLDEGNVQIKSTAGTFTIDKNISGLYLITGCELNFSNNEWNYILTLNKSSKYEDDMVLIPEED